MGMELFCKLCNRTTYFWTPSFLALNLIFNEEILGHGQGHASPRILTWELLVRFPWFFILIVAIPCLAISKPSFVLNLFSYVFYGN